MDPSLTKSHASCIIWLRCKMVSPAHQYCHDGSEKFNEAFGTSIIIPVDIVSQRLREGERAAASRPGLQQANKNRARPA